MYCRSAVSAIYVTLSVGSLGERYLSKIKSEITPYFLFDLFLLYELKLFSLI